MFILKHVFVSEKKATMTAFPEAHPASSLSALPHFHSEILLNLSEKALPKPHPSIQYILNHTNPSLA